MLHGRAVTDAALRIFFAQPNRQAAGQQLQEVVRTMTARWPRAAQLVAEAEGDILAYMTCSPEHWTRIYSTQSRKAKHAKPDPSHSRA